MRVPIPQHARAQFSTHVQLRPTQLDIDAQATPREIHGTGGYPQQRTAVVFCVGCAETEASSRRSTKRKKFRCWLTSHAQSRKSRRAPPADTPKRAHAHRRHDNRGVDNYRVVDGAAAAEGVCVAEKEAVENPGGRLHPMTHHPFINNQPPPHPSHTPTHRHQARTTTRTLKTSLSTLPTLPICLPSTPSSHTQHKSHADPPITDGAPLLLLHLHPPPPPRPPPHPHHHPDQRLPPPFLPSYLLLLLLPRGCCALNPPFRRLHRSGGKDTRGRGE